jgi:uncharacterized membrane protein
MSLESNKTLGGIGALLVAIGCIVPLLSLVGIILVLIALKGLADYYNESGIYQNALYGFIFYIIAVVAAAVMLIGIFFGGVFSMAPYPSESNIWAVIGGMLVALIVAFIFYLLGAIYFKRAFDDISAKSGEKMFGTGGMLMLLGAVLTIIFIGVILILIAWILIAVAFFSIKIPATAPPPPPPPQ